MAHKKEKFYAVYSGRVDKPTIYSSWSQAQPRVVGCKEAVIGKFDTLQGARNAMKLRGITTFDEVATHAAENEALPLPKGKFYAVAGGRTTGVFSHWQYAKESINGVPACHERFSTKWEAERFIENWKDAYADIWRREIRQALDDGWRPKDMDLNIESFLVRDDCNGQNDDNSLPKLEHLNIKGPQE